MKKNIAYDKTHQQRVFKALTAVIIILIATIGLLKHSIGGMITFVVGLFFGDLFVIIFPLLIIYALLILAKRGRKVFKRPFLVPLSIVLILTGISIIFQTHVTSWLQFGAELDTFLEVRHYIFKFENVTNEYLYGFMGLIGGTLNTLFVIYLGRGLTLAIAISLIVAGSVLFLWPLILMSIKKIIRSIKIYKRRQSILREARILPNLVSSEKLASDDKEIEVIGVPDDTGNTNPVPRGYGLKSVGVVEHQRDDEASSRKVRQKERFIDEDAGIKIPKLAPNELVEASIPTINQPSEQVKFDEEPEHDEFGLLSRVISADPLLEPVQVIEASNEKIEDEKQEETSHTGKKTKVTQDPKIQEMPNPLKKLDVDEEVIPNANSDTIHLDYPPTKSQPTMPLAPNPYGQFKSPGIDLLTEYETFDDNVENKGQAARNIEIINRIFEDFKIGAQAISYTIGPSFTRYDIKMDRNESVNALNPFIKDISMRLGGLQVRFEQVVLGKTTGGLEVPNMRKTLVGFKECVTKLPQNEKSKMDIPFGKDVTGEVQYGSFDAFPHLLVAGATGSGKSIFVHSIMMSLLMRNTPDELRLIIIDPKRVEMAKYQNIPHLLCPIIKDASEAKVALYKLVDEMELRYRKFEDAMVSKISQYNDEAKAKGKPLMPKIVVLVDEYADLFETEKDVSTPIVRLAQKSRAAGIHLLIATQRPSVSVITGVIKANLPTRVAFMTASAVDSQTILGLGGAEQLLGSGDMFVDSTALARKGLVRVQGAFVGSEEIAAVTNYLRQHYTTSFHPEFLDLQDRSSSSGSSNGELNDTLYPSAKEFAYTQERVSISKLQGVFNVGFPRAKTLYEMLVANNIIEVTDEANSSRGALVLPPRAPTRGERRIDDHDY